VTQRPSPWWQSSVVYQIYPRSFCDANGDGIGDLAGITSKLDYVQGLGVDIVWLSPIYKSPNDDNGYDVSDYRAIMPEFGTMEDFDRMLAEMHARGLKLMMDLVVNHTSDEHEWFRQARSSRDNPYHDYYIWSDPVEGREPSHPNNWESVFNGSAWEWNDATGEYFLHLFSRRQPELNWENERVRREVHDLMRFWLDKGVDGFRMDVINMISKPWLPDGTLPDAPRIRPGFLQPGFEVTVNGPRLEEFLREMKQEVLQHYDCVTVGETPGATTATARAITDQERGSLNMLFQFEHMHLDAQPGQTKWHLKALELADLKSTLSRWQEGLSVRGWNSLYLNNHDQPRAVSRFGFDGPYRVEAAKMLGALVHGMKGTPFVYQGEELGMTNFPFRSIDECQDIETLNMHADAVNIQGMDPALVMEAVRVKGRDNARTPMQWTSGPHGGFTKGVPWLAGNANCGAINAESNLGDPSSVFHFYRRLIALRREFPIIVHGQYALLDGGNPNVYAYARELDSERLLVICNFSAKLTSAEIPFDIEMSRYRLLLGNWDSKIRVKSNQLELRPYEAWILHAQPTFARSTPGSYSTSN
jgi:oligo-1,6-glucosidase